MTERQRVEIIDPATATSDGEQGPFPWDLYGRRCLAQGDSWFSIGAIPPTLTTRILAELRFESSTVIVNCARPGAVLHHMADTAVAPMFLRLLSGKRALKWHAILLSGGGNDLIDAVGSPPSADPARRLLRTAAERGPGPLTGADYLSPGGWQTFASHLGQVFHGLVDRRDAGLNRATPIVWHNYARVMPRPAPAGLGFGPWLLPALELFEVPASDRLLVADELLGRLRQLIETLVAERRAQDPQARIFVADSMAAGIELSAAGSTGESGDWINEIHLTKAGYRKCAQAWQQVLDPWLA